MRKEEELFYLIKHLSKSEKRQFRRLATLNATDSKVMGLYEYLTKVQEYSEDKLKKWHAQRHGNGQLLQLREHKRHLRKLILDHLRGFTPLPTPESQVHDLVQDALLLWGKELFNWADQLLEKARQLAFDLECYGQLLEILRHQRRHLKGHQQKGYEKKVEQLLQEGRKIAQLISRKEELSGFNDRLLLISRRTAEKLDDKTLDFVQTTKERLQNITIDPDSFTLQWQRHYGLALAARILKESQNSAYHFKAIVDIWEAKPAFIKAEPSRYKHAISNYLNISHLEGDYSPFATYIQKLERVKDKTPEQKTETFINIAFLEFLLFLNKPDVKEGIERLPDIEKGFEKHNKRIKNSRRVAFFENISLLYFLNNDFSKAYTWNEKILNSRESDTRKDVYRFAHIMRMVLDFETNDVNLQNTLSKSRRSLKAMDGLNPFEQLVLKYMQELATSHSDDIRSTVFKKMIASLEQLHSEQQYSPCFREFRLWVSSKVKQVTMESLMDRQWQVN